MLVVSVCFMVPAACSDTKKWDYQVYSFQTNGKRASFSYFDQDFRGSIKITDMSGNEIKTFSEPGISYGYGYVGRDRFYYVSSVLKENTYEILFCNQSLEDCKPIHRMQGAIRFPVELDESNILFAHSPIRKETISDSGFVDFSFYKFNIKTREINKVSRELYIVSAPLIKIGDDILFNGKKVSDIGKEMPQEYVERRIFIDSIEYNLLTNESKYTDISDDISGASINLFYKNDEVNYVYGGISNKSGNYIYTSCAYKLFTECYNNISESTNFDTAGGKIYYATRSGLDFYIKELD